MGEVKEDGQRARAKKIEEWSDTDMDEVKEDGQRAGSKKEEEGSEGDMVVQMLVKNWSIFLEEKRRKVFQCLSTATVCPDQLCGPTQDVQSQSVQTL